MYNLMCFFYLKIIIYYHFKICHKIKKKIKIIIINKI